MMQLGFLSQSPKLQAIGASVPIGVSGSIIIGGTNGMTTNQKMGAQWIVRDPDGVVVDSYEDWEMFWTGPGLEQVFVGNRFDLVKPGTYTVKAGLLMNYDDPVVVDTYDGDLCTVTTEVPPVYEEIQHTIYPYAYVHDGAVEMTTATFKTDPFTPSRWAAQKFADAVANEVEKRGGRVIELKAYVDTTPLLWTNFRIDVISTPLGATSGIGVGIPIWVAILIIALAIIAVIVIATLAVKTIVSTFTHKPINEEIKKAMSREALIILANDFEEKLELPLTPPEELDKKADQELRDYCDQRAEEIVPPAVSWVPLAVIGGLGVLGLGAVFALAASRK